ncbi:MAG: VOC family protein [Chitinophagaceae bacterium]|nr:VOC family protein [Chitinophagaceae bacterium]
MPTVNKINSCLWFDNQAEVAARYYSSIFKKSKIGIISYYGKEGFEEHKRPEGSVMTVQFWLEDHEFLALNGGPVFKFNESVSFVVNCDTQEEIDYYWEKLSAGGDVKSQQCGWLKDKFGLSWQIVTPFLAEVHSQKTSAKTESVMHAMMQMKKLDIAKLREAYEHPALTEA